MADMEKLSIEKLEEVAGGQSSSKWKEAVVKGTTYYLALRSQAAYDDSNEIGKLHNGDVIKVRPDIKSSVYIWANALGKEGWVNGDYVKIRK